MGKGIGVLGKSSWSKCERVTEEIMQFDQVTKTRDQEPFSEAWQHLQAVLCLQFSQYALTSSECSLTYCHLLTNCLNHRFLIQLRLQHVDEYQMINVALGHLVLDMANKYLALRLVTLFLKLCGRCKTVKHSWDKFYMQEEKWFWLIKVMVS